MKFELKTTAIVLLVVLQMANLFITISSLRYNSECQVGYAAVIIDGQNFLLNKCEYNNYLKQQTQQHHQYRQQQPQKQLHYTQA